MTRPFAQGLCVRVDPKRDGDRRRRPPPMCDERAKRLGKPELVERSRTEIGKDAPVLDLQRFDLRLDRVRRRGGGGIAAGLLGENRRARPQGKQMRTEFVMELVCDHPPLLVMGVEHPLHQFAIGAAEAVERLSGPAH